MNEAMQKPTAEQEQTISSTLATLEAAVHQTNGARVLISKLRTELNDSNMLLAKLRNVIGVDAYIWNDRTRWHDVIDKRMALNKEALK